MSNPKRQPFAAISIYAALSNPADPKLPRRRRNALRSIADLSMKVAHCRRAGSGTVHDDT